MLEPQLFTSRSLQSPGHMFGDLISFSHESRTLKIQLLTDTGFNSYTILLLKARVAKAATS